MKKTILPIVVLLFSITLTSQNTIKAKKGYSPNIGILVSMLDDLKTRITYSVSSLDQEATDFLLDEEANSIGAMVFHLAATEKYYQVYTFEGRVFTKEEDKVWGAAMNLGDAGREKLKGNPIKYYLDIWDEVRKDTKRLLKTKDDVWLQKKPNRMNYHWAWYHVMEHQANHMGQIRLIAKRVK